MDIHAKVHKHADSKTKQKHRHTKAQTQRLNTPKINQTDTQADRHTQRQTHRQADEPSNKRRKNLTLASVQLNVCSGML